jgi:hypothetical protein
LATPTFSFYYAATATSSFAESLGAFGATSVRIVNPADYLCLLEPLFQLFIDARIQFRHSLGLVAHPEIVDVFLAPLASS